jgi:hypothetical protein
MTRTTSPNPLIVDYGGADGRRFWLLGLEGDRRWPVPVRWRTNNAAATPPAAAIAVMWSAWSMSSIRTARPCSMP